PPTPIALPPVPFAPPCPPVAHATPQSSSTSRCARPPHATATQAAPITHPTIPLLIRPLFPCLVFSSTPTPSESLAPRSPLPAPSTPPHRFSAPRSIP